MRQLFLRVPADQAERVVEVARRHEVLDLVELRAEHGRALIVGVLDNGRIGDLLHDLEDVPEVRASFLPSGALTVRPSRGESPERLEDVTLRSPIEVHLGGLQSIGGWGGYVGYAVAAGLVAWTGLVTDKEWLLVGAMLIAPFTGPAMNAALGTAAGDLVLLRQGVVRYAAGLAMLALAAAAAAALFDTAALSETMVRVSRISEATVVLPLTAGAAGALHLLQSERNSLVSGAALGVLVSASLAPPAALAGIASVLGRWDVAAQAVFLLVLQLVGIHVTAAVGFRLGGVRPGATLFGPEGSRVAFPAGVAAAALAVAALLGLQLGTDVALERSSLAAEVRAEAQAVVRDSGRAWPLRVRAEVPVEGVPDQETVLVELVVQPRVDADVTATLEALVAERLAARYPDLTPVIEVTAVGPLAREVSTRGD